MTATPHFAVDQMRGLLVVQPTPSPQTTSEGQDHMTDSPLSSQGAEAV